MVPFVLESQRSPNVGTPFRRTGGNRTRAAWATRCEGMTRGMKKVSKRVSQGATHPATTQQPEDCCASQSPMAKTLKKPLSFIKRFGVPRKIISNSWMPQTQSQPPKAESAVCPPNGNFMHGRSSMSRKFMSLCFALWLSFNQEPSHTQSRTLNGTGLLEVFPLTFETAQKETDCTKLECAECGSTTYFGNRPANNLGENDGWVIVIVFVDCLCH